MGDDKSVTVQGNNSGIIITGDYNTIHLNNENLLKKEIVTNTFKSYYQNHFKTISLLIEDEKKPIDDIYVNLAIIREEKEEDIKDKSKLLDRDKIINSYEEIYKPKEPIAIEKLIEKSFKSNSAKALIYGKAGIGKTTFCKYIAYRWAKGELYSEFENIVYIALREWKEGGLESVIKKIYFEDKHKSSAIEIEQSKTLFLFDGYDELSDTSVLHNAIKKYNLQNYIITSRPYGYRKSDFDVNEVFETIGFTDEDVTAYIDKFFTDQNHKTNLQNFLKQNINIRHIAYIPLMLEMICSLWREKAKSNQSFLSPMTMTELYSEVVNDMLSKYARRKKYEDVYKRKYKKDIFLYLGQIAFEALKKQTIVINGEILEDVIENIKTDDEDEFLEKHIFYTGFLKSNNKSEDPWSNNYQFPHLTFQEYFSALYVSKLPKEEIAEIIRDYKFYPYMQVFFAFLGGLVEDKEWFLKEFENKPRDELGYYGFLLWLDCISEIKEMNINISSFNSNLSDWIKIIIYKETNFKDKIFFDKLEKVSKWLNNDTIKILLSIFNDISINPYYKIKLEKFLSNINQEIKSLILDTNGDDNKIEFIRNNKINISFREEVAKSLFNVNREDDAFINSLIELIKDKEIDFKIRKEVAKSLLGIKRSDDAFVNNLIKLVKDKTIDINIREELVKSLSSTNTYDNNTISTLLNFIQNDRREILNTLQSLIFENHEIIGNIMEFIKAEKLGYHNKKYDEKFVNSLIGFVKNEKIPSYIREEVIEALLILVSKDISILNKIDIDKYFPKDYIKKSSIELLFEVYDKKYIKLDKIIENTLYNTLPLYLKNNKLCTIYENQEIQTQREVTLEEIERVKRELGLISYTSKDE